MTEIKFKPLEASDVEARVGKCSEKGCSLLLYKDARCDMRLLDETVGPERWQCDYRDIKGNLFCRVGILTDTGEWVYKEDVGIPSNMDAQKGEASDAFKRACFKWGIGRELYTAPFIWVPKESLTSLKRNDKGKWACYDRFTVSSMAVENGIITEVIIKNGKTNQVVWGKGANDAPKPTNGDDNNDLLRARVALKGLQEKADELGCSSDFVEVTSNDMFGKDVSDLDIDQCRQLWSSVSKSIDDIEKGEA